MSSVPNASKEHQSRGLKTRHWHQTSLTVEKEHTSPPKQLAGFNPSIQPPHLQQHARLYALSEATSSEPSKSGLEDNRSRLFLSQGNLSKRALQRPQRHPRLPPPLFKLGPQKTPLLGRGNARAPAEYLSATRAKKGSENPFCKPS